MNIHKMNNKTSLSTWLFRVVSMVFDSLTLNEWAVVIGISATIFSFLINWYYKHQEVKIKKQSLENHGHGHKNKNSKKANAENKVIYKHENGEYELIDQLTYQTCSYVNSEWIEDATKKAAYQQKIINMNKLTSSNLLDEANN